MKSKAKWRTKIICLIACLVMLVGSTVCVSAEENTYRYVKDGPEVRTYEVRTGPIPALDDNGLPAYHETRRARVTEVCGTTPGGVYVYWYPNELYTDEQIALLYAAIDAAGITNEMSKYDKAVAVNNYVCGVLAYDAARGSRIPYADGLIALQMGGSAICEIYADLYQTMCETIGIECDVVSGKTHGNVAHAWNAVYIDGKEYFVDPTWNDMANSPNRYLMSETNWPDHEFVSYTWQTWNEADAFVYQNRALYRCNYGPDDLMPIATDEDRAELQALIDQFGPLNWGSTQFITVNGQTYRVN